MPCKCKLRDFCSIQNPLEAVPVEVSTSFGSLRVLLGFLSVTEGLARAMEPTSNLEASTWC
jgi:hypothetical protein